MLAFEAAEFLHISERFLLMKAASGELPCVRIGRRALFTRDGLSGWLAEQEAASLRPAADLDGTGVRLPIRTVRTRIARTIVGVAALTCPSPSSSSASMRADEL